MLLALVDRQEIGMHTFASIEEVGFTPIFFLMSFSCGSDARARLLTAYQERTQAPLLELRLNGHRI